MSTVPDGALLDAVRAVARRAGDAILAIYDTDFDVQQKHDDSPLTDADLAAHRAIVDGLAALEPALPVLSEEGTASAGERRAWPRYWLVDPLDGTREFVKRNGEFTVNIALVDDHRPVLGVVLAPVTGVCYAAAAGLGAWRDDGRSAPVPIRVRPRPAGALVVAGSRSHQTDAGRAFIENLGPAELMSVGSSLKFCLVAEGRADIYPRFGPTSEWDTAAAQCVVEQAGGRVTDLAGESLRYNTRDSLLNPYFVACGDPRWDWRPAVPAGVS